MSAEQTGSGTLTLIRIGIVLAGAAAAGIAAASGPADLYRADAIVTGQSEKTRRPGFEECLREVVLRVSGDQRLLQAPGLHLALSDAADFIADFSYRDRMAGIPIHDDQGTYDRPYDLTCHFERARIDDLLASLGSRPWPEPRPPLAFFLAVEQGDRRFVLASDGVESQYMAESLLAAAAQMALKVSVPGREALAAAGIDFESLRFDRPERLGDVARTFAPNGEVLLGRLVWSDAEPGWVADWAMSRDGRQIGWQVRGVNFDAAFRNAIYGAAQLMSGNGEPQQASDAGAEEEVRR